MLPGAPRCCQLPSAAFKCLQKKDLRLSARIIYAQVSRLVRRFVFLPTMHLLCPCLSLLHMRNNLCIGSRIQQVSDPGHFFE